MEKSKETLARVFRDPPAEYGAIDGWWWEAGHLDRDKMRWQLEELKDKGVSGTWFYSRYVYGEPLGSDPAYFSDGWWEFTRWAAEEHRRLGLINWFSNWTLLGFEQDAIRANRDTNPELWGRGLVIHRARSDDDLQPTLETAPEDEVLDAAAYKTEGDAIDYATRVDLNDSVRDGKLTWTAPGPGWLVAVIAARPWDLDYLTPEIGNRWADVILGEYERRLPGLMGDSPAAFGPDEMMLLKGTTMYSSSLRDEVGSKLGHDPAPYLIGLFHDIGPKTQQIRCNYYAVMTALLDENFYRAPTAWLHDRGMQHVSLSQLGASPVAHTFNYGDFFRYLRSFDVPGNEDPGPSPVGQRRLVRSKISSSVAHLYGRGRAILLAHYCAGWGHTFEENLAWTNEAYAKGLNLYSRHLGSYSLMGGWYEYVPPSDHWYHPYWRYWKHFADYVRRLSFLMSQGKHRPDVALLYPLTTIHAHWIAGRESDSPLAGLPGTSAEAEDDAEGGGADDDDADDLEGMKAFFDATAFDAGKAMAEVAQAIYFDGIDFDFVDNPSLESATVNGKVLDISGLEFRCVLLPPMTTIPLAIVEMMKRFYDAGGTVGAYGRLPRASAENGGGDPKLQDLLEGIFGVRSHEGVSEPLTRANGQGGRAFFVPNDAGRVAEAISDAIVRDVVASERGIFQTHQRIGDLDAYFIFNVLDQERDLTFRLRVDGEIERWDPNTGRIQPVHRTRRDGETTEVRLAMGPYEGVVLVCSPGAQRAVVVEDNLFVLAAVEEQAGETLTVRSFEQEGGDKSARLIYGGHEYTASGTIEAPPGPITIEELFDFRLEPTMDNRWGDFRYPASETTIGAEARRFRYREEERTAGADLNWHASAFDHSDWQEVTYSYGPYWLHLGPFEEGAEPEGLLARAKRGDETLGWDRYSFSKKFGYEHLVPGTPLAGVEHLLGVPENFIAFPREGVSGPAHHYLFTTVVAQEDGEYLFLLGHKADHAFISGSDELLGLADHYQVPRETQLWINGEETLRVTDQEGAEVRAKVHLTAGRNAVLLRIVMPESGPAQNYAAFLSSEPEAKDPYVPLLSWFIEQQRLVYDIKPDEPTRVGWYRFTAPPGLREMNLKMQARKVEAWIDGTPHPVRDGTIVVETARPETSQVALRVEQEPGTYAGAAFSEPVAFRCEQGRIQHGDWSRFGLATYSGIGVYGTEVTLGNAHSGCRVQLDLGHVKTVAEVSVNGQPAGVKMARPFRFDITDLVHTGLNRLEIKVANTLANHYSTYPTRWIFDGQTVSGLLGPVQLRFLRPAVLTAKRS